MNREIRDFVKDIIEASTNAETFLEEMTYDTFIRDSKTIYAVIRALEIVGEASSRLPVEIRNKYPQVPWKEIIGMRSKLIHDYFGARLKIIWKTVKEDIPVIKIEFQKIFDELNG
jgi:uncharacterized protein with HEPN domain